MSETPFDLIAFDADDTLWESESLYAEAHEKFYQRLEAYAARDLIAERMQEINIHNLQYYGYGVKGFTLSLIETAIELTDGRIPPEEIRKLLDEAKDMLTSQLTERQCISPTPSPGFMKMPSRKTAIARTILSSNTWVFCRS